MQLLSGASVTMRLPKTFAAGQGQPSIVRYENDVSYDVTHTATIHAGDARLKSFELWLPVPTDHPEQMIHDLRITPKLKVRQDSTGLATVAGLYSTSRRPKFRRNLTVEMTYRLTSRRIVVDRSRISAVDIGAYRQDTEYRIHTRPETKIECDDPEIRRNAKLLRDGRMGTWEYAKAAYNWVLNRTRYQLIDEVRGATYCLREGHGECSEYSALFVALCRAAGIPARPVVGFWADETDGWHIWAEFMLPNGDWIPVDPSIGDQGVRSRAVSFADCDNRRGVLCKTFNVRLPKKSTGEKFVDILQLGAWWYRLSSPSAVNKPAISFTIRGRRSVGGKIE